MQQLQYKLKYCLYTMVNSRTYRCDSNKKFKKQIKPLQMLKGLLSWKEDILISDKKTWESENLTGKYIAVAIDYSIIKLM